MAPEQLRGEPADRTTDAYGSGATAFDLRYGQPPYAGPNDALDVRAAPRFPPPSTPAEAFFQEVVRTMLARRKEDRPQDLCAAAAQFATLHRALQPGREQGDLAALDRNAFRLAGCEIVLRAGDIADERADGIVASAGYDMRMRTGSSDALRRRGGDEIEREATKDGEHALGECVLTAAGRLDARYVLHAVSAWEASSCVGRTTLRAMSLADRIGLRTLAFPALGTGAARVSMETCANAMMSALRMRLQLGGSRLQRVTIVLGDEAKLAAFRDVAVEALRGTGEAPRAPDLGLPVEHGEVAAEGPTFIDAGHHGSLVTG
jgi:serine/threonine-protein kinase